MGLALLILYVIQILLGAIAHFFKLPSLFRGRRPAHSYLHVLVGLAIIAAAQWQVSHLSIRWFLWYTSDILSFFPFPTCRSIMDCLRNGSLGQEVNMKYLMRLRMHGSLWLSYVKCFSIKHSSNHLNLHSYRSSGLSMGWAWRCFLDNFHRKGKIVWERRKTLRQRRPLPSTREG